MYPKLKATGWNGYWIDAASALRMEKRCDYRIGSGKPTRHFRRFKKNGIKNFCRRVTVP
ncbi:hypothetical protein M6G44_00025 [Actinobacillus pleuropneumoniae]|nr:hypothetical protein M6G44_00025 [Actinobacillus pleuropneumoniae]